MILLYKFEIPRAIRPYDDTSISPECASLVEFRHLYQETQTYQINNFLENTKENFLTVLRNKYIKYTDNGEDIKLTLSKDSVSINSYLVVKYDPSATNLENMFESEEHKKYDYYNYKEKFGLPIGLSLLVYKNVKQYGGLSYININDGDYSIIEIDHFFQ